MSTEVVSTGLLKVTASPQWRWHLQDLSPSIVLTCSSLPWPVPVCGPVMLKGRLGLLIPSGDPGPMGPPGRHGHRGPKGEKGEKGMNICHAQESRVCLLGSGGFPRHQPISGNCWKTHTAPFFLFVLGLLSFFPPHELLTFLSPGEQVYVGRRKRRSVGV